MEQQTNVWAWTLLAVVALAVLVLVQIVPTENNRGKEHQPSVDVQQNSLPPQRENLHFFSRRNEGMALGDLDDDGLLDMVYAVRLNQNFFCRGMRAPVNLLFSHCYDIEGEAFDSMDVALGDVDLDGDLDAVFANGFLQGQSNELCLGERQGHFNCEPFAYEASQSHGVALGDLNGDGWLDVVFANFHGKNEVCINLRAPPYYPQDVCHTYEDIGPASEKVMLVDVNVDHHLDAIVVHALATQLCLGNGTGRPFEESRCGYFDTNGLVSYGVASGDFNEDGAPDVVLATQGTNQICYGHLPFDIVNFLQGCINFDDREGHRRDVVSGDINNDGHMDIVFVDDGGLSPPHLFCMGDGAGEFQCQPHLSPYEGRKVVLGDINANGKLDMVLDHEVCFDVGHLPEATTGRCNLVGRDQLFTRSLAVMDLNSDGFDDVVLANLQQSWVCWGSQNIRSFADLMAAKGCQSINYFAANSLNIGLGDLNNDQHGDIIFVNAEDNAHAVCLSRQMSQALFPTQCSLLNLPAKDVTLEDMNKDGYLDAVFTGHSNHVCLNDKTDVVFSASMCYELDSAAESIALDAGDLNADGYPDIVFVNGVQDEVCLGDSGSQPAKHCEPLWPARMFHIDVDLLDMNNDGITDAVFQGAFSSRVCMGYHGGPARDLTQCVQLEALNQANNQTLTIKPGHFNQDQYVDLLLVNRNSDRVCYSMVTSLTYQFDCREINLVQQADPQVALGDINGDGYADIVLTSLSHQDHPYVCMGAASTEFVCEHHTSMNFDTE